MNHQSPSVFRRREFLSTLSCVGALAAVPTVALAAPEPARKGRLRQGLCQGVFNGSKLDMEGMCREAARLGAVGFDLVGPESFTVLKKYGLIPTMLPGGSGIDKGINDQRNHVWIAPKMREAIKAAASVGAPNVIVMAGDRAGLTDAEGADHSVEFLNNIKGMAEEMNVTLCVELLNSKVNHKGYMADHTSWGVEVCKRVNSPNVKLLYDIYHMQIMEGDVIRTIRDNIKYIGHFHTAGNPGRNQFDETQELNYSAICKAIADAGFQGILSHEYTPTRDVLPTLEKMMQICEV